MTERRQNPERGPTPERSRPAPAAVTVARNPVARSAGPTDPHIALRRALGNRHLVQRACRECEEEKEESGVGMVQPKAAGPEAATSAGSDLTISRPGDPFEAEADRVADHVVQRLAEPAGPMSSGAGAPALQRACTECSIAAPTEEELATEGDESSGPPAVSPKSRSTDGGAPRRASDEFGSDLRRSRGGGSPLPPTVRQEMETGFGQDFGHVRIHTGGRSEAMNRSIHAKAFTHRSDIYFDRGMYDPGSTSGRFLLAHELTHVVQQTGGRPAPPIQRSTELKIGNWAHARIQEGLRGMDKELITEAPIPGGTRHGKKHNSVGFADLYKAPGQVMSGISAQESAASKDMLTATYKYVNMRRDWRDRADSNSPVDFGPTIHSRRRTWDFSPGFPASFEIGEIKPLFWTDFPRSSASLGAGISQEGNYREGFEEFAARTYTDNPTYHANLPAAIHGTPIHLGPSRIPAAIDYARFEAERSTRGRDAIMKRDTNQRVWIYELGGGVVFYFLLPHPYAGQDYPKQADRQLRKLDPLLDELRQQRPRMGPGLGPKTREGRPAGGEPPAVRRRARPPAVQRKETDWRKKQRDWEAGRKAWVTGKGTTDPKPREFLKEQAEGVEKKGKIDDKLGVTPSKTLGEQVKEAKKIRFWSGFRGRILGALRFRFGSAFDKAEKLFEDIKAKFRKHRKNADGLRQKNGIFSGWKKVATAAILRFGVEIFKEMLASAFRRFASCMNDVVKVILGKYTSAVDDAKQEVMEEVEPICCEVMDFKAELEKTYQQHEETISSFSETVETIREWREILDDVETAVRIGVQVVSCGSPPALGCLWGLVAQIGISAGLSLLARTDYFDEEIARPAANKLMDTLVGDSLQNLLLDVLESTPLKPYVAEAAACSRATATTGSTTIGGNLEKLDPNDPKIAKLRQEWEDEHRDEMLADLRRVFQKGEGREVTLAELQELVELLKKSGKTLGQNRRLLEASLDPASGRLRLELARDYLETGEMPAQEAEERDVDYEKATRNNPRYAENLGWDPIRFVKLPGLRVDSEGFADAVYDLQEAIGVKPDGMLGPDTVIAFYGKNSLPRDAVYREAVRARDEKRKAEEEARRRAAEAERGEEGTPEEAKVPPAPPFTLLYGPSLAISGQRRQHIPRGVGIHLHSPEIADLVGQSPRSRSATLEVIVDGVHRYRIQNVALKRASEGRILAVPRDIPTLLLELEDGIELRIDDERTLTMVQQFWRTD